jgi:hypothetical protein
MANVSMAADGARAQKLLLRQLFPNIEKVVFTPPIQEFSNPHAGELEFLGPKSGRWLTYRYTYSHRAARLMPHENMKFEFRFLGIVGA